MKYLLLDLLMKKDFILNTLNLLVFQRFPFVRLYSVPVGKSVLLVWLILDVYRDVYERVYVFSPSINRDSIWDPVKKYVNENLKVDPEKEPCFMKTIRVRIY